jgi:phosphogluconate dehydratase
VRQLYAESKVDRAELLEAEPRPYHAPGTSFVNPGRPLRDALTRAAAKCA